MQNIFSNDFGTKKPHIVIPGKKIENPAKIISSSVTESVLKSGEEFSKQINNNFVADFSF